MESGRTAAEQSGWDARSVIESWSLPGSENQHILPCFYHPPLLVWSDCPRRPDSVPEPRPLCYSVLRCVDRRYRYCLRWRLRVTVTRLLYNSS